MNGFIEIERGLWYEEATGLPWSSKYLISKGRGYGSEAHYDGKMKKLTNIDAYGYYIVGHGGKNRKWHRLVYERLVGPIDKGKVIDHINNIPSDNLISNLHQVTKKYNARKAKINSKNTTGFAGVYYRKDRNRFISQIRVGDKQIKLGSFVTLRRSICSLLGSEEEVSRRRVH